MDFSSVRYFERLQASDSVQLEYQIQGRLKMMRRNHYAAISVQIIPKSQSDSNLYEAFILYQGVNDDD